MAPIRSLIDQFSSQSPTSNDADLVLGLPLESGDRTIYPVFRDPDPSGQNGAEPRQIGYLEISEGRSDYTSLEPDNRPVLLALTVLTVVVVSWLLWRFILGNRG